ncbi:MAG TPA: phosphotransacetylase [Ktedonobacteraceae bacterium]|nr:phosphotransacetylase [Ktedonobacteraceae bacterium]
MVVSTHKDSDTLAFLQGTTGATHSIEYLRQRAMQCKRRIVLTDGEDPRILAALREVERDSNLEFILVGQTSVLLPHVRHMSARNQIEIYNPLRDKRQAHLEQLLCAQFEKRQKPLPDAATLSRMALDSTYIGALLLKAGLADGMVGGANVPTATVIRAGLRVVGVDPANPVVSGAFIMLLSERLPAGQNALVFADAAVIPQPTAEQLASITLNTAGITRSILGQDPVVALLSFSTRGSSEDPSITKMMSALQLVRQQAPELCVDGEMQLDAALIPEISASKAPGNAVAGRANVLIFPNLDASNIAYKLVERVGHATALGVILSGLAMPINDLSRGCSVDDVMNMIAVTALQSTATDESYLLSAR